MACKTFYSCLLKTNALIVALLAIAVLGISTIVLVSAVAHTRAGDSIGGADTSKEGALENGYGNASYRQDYNRIISEENPSNSDAKLVIDQLRVSSPVVADNSSETSDRDSAISAQAKLNEAEKSTSSPPFEYTPSNNDDDADGGADNGNQMSTTESSATATQPKDDAFFDKHFNFWKGKSDTYIKLMQASSGTGLCAAFLQLAFSWFLICGSNKNKDLKERKKLWNLSNLISLILMVLAIFVPLSYDDTRSTFKGTGVFWKEMYRTIITWFQNFSSATLESVWNRVSNFSGDDLTLFYFMLGANGVMLLAFLVPPLFWCLFYPCRRCCCRPKSTRTDSDLLLFGHSEPF